MKVERLGILARGNDVAPIGIADGDRMDDNVLLTQSLQSRTPSRGVILTVGKNNDRSSLGMLLGTQRLERGVQSSTQVGAARLDRPRPEPVQGFEYGAQVLGQRAADHTAAGKCNQPNAVGRIGSQGVHQTFGHLDPKREPIGHGIFRRHAATDVDRQQHVVPGR
jgi:hypothetical protein